MMLRSRLFTVVCGAILVLWSGACASPTISDNGVKNEVEAMQNGPESSQQLLERVLLKIKDHLEFTAEQKEKLKQITSETHERNNKLRSEMGNLKILLVEEVLKLKPDERRLAVIKKQIKANYKQMAESTMKAFDQARTTLGNRKVESTDRREMLQMMFLYHLQ